MTTGTTPPKETDPKGKVLDSINQPEAGDGSVGSVETNVGVSVAEVARRRRLITTLAFLSVVLFGMCALFYRYIRQPAPLPDLVPAPLGLNYPPHYLFSIYGVDNPVSVAISPDGEPIYVAEIGGDRLVKMFDRDGGPLGAFSPPLSSIPERAPVYLAVAPAGQVYVSDRTQHAVFVYDADGNYLDTILSPTQTLRQYLSKHLDGLPSGIQFAYNLYQPDVYYQIPGEEVSSLPAPDDYNWSPLGVRFDQDGRLLLTDVTEEQDAVYVIASEVISATDWSDFNPPVFKFGAFGQEGGEFTFPNNAVVDSNGRFYVVDGNNSRISVWDSQGKFLFNFGRGTGSGAINLPRGVAIDTHDRLYVVDAVGQAVKVYDVSGEEVEFMFSFGDFGVGNGLFNYPNDIAIDDEGRLYIADRENNRIQVWLY